MKHWIRYTVQTWVAGYFTETLTEMQHSYEGHYIRCTVQVQELIVPIDKVDDLMEEKLYVDIRIFIEDEPYNRISYEFWGYVEQAEVDTDHSPDEAVLRNLTIIGFMPNHPIRKKGTM